MQQPPGSCCSIHALFCETLNNLLTWQVRPVFILPINTTGFRVEASIYFPVGSVVCSRLTLCHLVCRMMSDGMKMTRLSHCWSAAVDILSETISCFKENQCLCDSVPCNTVSLCSGFTVIYYHEDRRIS